MKRETRGFDEVVGAIAGECLAVRLRMVNRAVTAVYDDALRPFGVKASQVNVLTVVGKRGAVTPGEIGRLLCIEKSTLSRNLERLRARGWLERVAGDDERSRRIRLTGAGRRLLRRAFPAWKDAQRRSTELLGGAGVEAVGRLADRVWSREAA